MTKCPFCKEEIKEGAVKCKHCGEILDKSAYTQISDPTTAHATTAQDSFIEPTATQTTPSAGTNVVNAQSAGFDFEQFCRWASHLGLGERIILGSATAALLSLFMPWVAMGIISSSGWNQQGYLFCLLFVYPVFGAVNVNGLNKIAGAICGVLALAISIWYIADKHFEFMGVSGNAAASGLYMFLASTVGLLVGVYQYKPKEGQCT